MPEITAQELRAETSSGELRTLYILTGEEKLTLKRAAARLIDRAAGESFPEFNRSIFTNESDIDSIIDAVEALPFMAERKCAAVKDFDPESKSPEDLDALCGALSDLPETTTLIFYYPTMDIPAKKSAKWKKFLDRAGKAGAMVEFKKLTDSELYQLLKKSAERQGCGLPRKSFDRLRAYAGGDLGTLRGELEKLCAYTLGLGQKEITPGFIEELTPKSTETKVFAMVGDLTAGRYGEAYKKLDGVLSQGEKPVTVLGAMASAYIDMYRVKAALESGLTASAPAEYAPEYKGGGFRLRNAERAARRLSMGSIRNCLGLLADADMSLKGSGLEPRLVLEGLMSRLLTAVQG